MFNFKFDNSNQTQVSSTGVKRDIYEEKLIQILSLPLKTHSRSLEMPCFIQQHACDYKLIGEEIMGAIDCPQAKYNCIAPLNEVCNKVNVDTYCNWSDNTQNDTFEFEQEAYIGSTNGEENDFNKENQGSLVKLLDMPADEQEKKGLLGLQFKIIKVAHEETQRLRTKFVCTYENCGKICENKWSFLDHNRHHTGFRPYECKVCKKRFTQRGNLRQHLMIHKE